MKKYSLSFIGLLLLSFLIIPFKATAIENNSDDDMTNITKACDFIFNERRLWVDHTLWSRSFIISDVDSLGDKDAVLQRLLKNQDDIGNSIKPYYGEEAGNKLAALLREHIELAGKVIEAAKSNNKTDLDKYNKLWHTNADEIAKFLASINPNLSESELKDMLYIHLRYLTKQTTYRLNKDWDKEIADFDKNEDHMIHFADIISKGTIKEFPEKFK